MSLISQLHTIHTLTRSLDRTQPHSPSLDSDGEQLSRCKGETSLTSPPASARLTRTNGPHSRYSVVQGEDLDVQGYGFTYTDSR